MNRVRRTEDGLQTELAAIGLTDGDFAECDEILALRHLMTDASKCQRDEGTLDPEDDENVDGAELSHTICCPGSSWSSRCESFLAERCTALSESGTYKVAFGKYKRKKTYFQGW